MFFQAVRTAIFLSLLIVLGTSSEHGTGPVVVTKGESSPDAMISLCALLQGLTFSSTGNGSSSEELVACGANGNEVCEVLGLNAEVT